MSRLIILYISLIILLATCPMALPVQAASETISGENALLQFTSAGHVLGFAPGEFYAAGGNHALRVQFVNSSIVRPVAGKTGGQKEAVPMEKVTYKGIWNGVDIEYTAVQGGIAESNYYLKSPEAVEGIRLRYNRPVSLNQQGELVIACTGGQMVESAPIAWQEVEGSREYVRAEYVIYGANEVGFTLADCRAGLAVVIDPVIVWNTFMGGSESDIAYGIAVDEASNVYITGTSMSTWGTPIRSYLGNGDAFVAKTNSTGELQWNTFLGGSGTDDAMNIVEWDGFVYVVGTSDSLWSAPSRKYSGGKDAFVAKLNGQDGNLIWNSFLGNQNEDEGKGIAVNGNELYVTGLSHSSWGTPVRGFQGADENAFVACLYCQWGDLKWNTFLGGSSGSTAGYAICTNGKYIYVAGDSYCTWGDPRRTYSAGNTDAFVARLKLTGELQWNTFLGAGGHDDIALGIAVDNIGDVLVTGSSYYTWGTPRRAFGGGLTDGFAAKLNYLGDLQWNTFLGGNAIDEGLRIVVDDRGNSYIAGGAEGTWGTPWRNYEGTSDAFVAKLDTSGGLVSHGFFGGSGNVYGQCIAMDSVKNIYLAGGSGCSWGTPVHDYSGGGLSDAYIVKINDPDLGGLPPILTNGPATAAVTTKLGIVSFATSAGGINNLVNITPTSIRCSPPSGYTFPYGIFGFNIAGLANRETVRVTLRFPSSLPVGTKYYKCINGTMMDCTPIVTHIDRYTLQLALTDGCPFDADGAANGTIVDPGGPAFPNSTPHPSSAQMPVIAPEKPVSLSNITVKSATLSASKVIPGTPVTVTANIVNTGTGNGASIINVYVNGEQETQQGVTVNSGGVSTMTFNVSRNDPGTYTVYVNGANAGSFTVDQFTPDTILFISGALVLFALVGCVIWMTRRKY